MHSDLSSTFFSCCFVCLSWYFTDFTIVNHHETTIWGRLFIVFQPQNKQNRSFVNEDGYMARLIQCRYRLLWCSKKVGRNRVKVCRAYYHHSPQRYNIARDPCVVHSPTFYHSNQPNISKYTILDPMDLKIYVITLHLMFSILRNKWHVYHVSKRQVPL